VPVPFDGPTGVPASEPGVRELIPPATGTREGKTGRADDPTRIWPGVARSGEPSCVGVAEAGASPDPSLAGTSMAGEPPEEPSPDAPGRPGKAPSVATAIAATITHAPAAAIPIRPARRPGRARRLAAAVARAGLDAATGEACRSAILAPPAADPAARTVPSRRGVSTSRSGAHLRQAPSTRFQQSEQHVTPQPGQAWSETWADANESLSRPQRSQNWAPRSTSHSRLARPLRTYPLVTVAAARCRGARRWYRARRAFVPSGAGRHRRERRAPQLASRPGNTGGLSHPVPAPQRALRSVRAGWTRTGRPGAIPLGETIWLTREALTRGLAQSAQCRAERLTRPPRSHLRRPCNS